MRRPLILPILCLLLLAAWPAWSQPSGAPGPMPPRMAEEVVEFLEWSMQTRLGDAERRSVADSLRAGWERGTSGDIAGMRAIHGARDSVSRMSPRDRAVVRPALERQFVRGFRQQPTHPAARVFLPAYASRRRDAPAVPWPGEALIAAPVAAPAPPAALPARPAAPAAPPVNPAAAAGASPRLHARTSMAHSAFGSTISTYYLALFPDGRYYRGFYPAEGVAEFDWSFWCAREGGTCGTYRERSEVAFGRERRLAALRDARGREEEVTLATEPGNFQPFIALHSMDGVRLNATYHANCHNEFEATLQLTRDGRFTERDLLGCAWVMIRGHYLDDRETYLARRTLSQSRRTGSGSYTIHANTLELRYADGPVIRLGVHVDAPWTPAAGDPAQLCVAGTCLQRIR